MYYYQFNIGDYAQHTRHLTLLEDLAYRRLLDLYYMVEKPLTEDKKKLSRLIGMPDNHEDVSQVLDDFFSLSESGYCHERADREIEWYREKSNKAMENGKKGGRPKKPKSPAPAPTPDPKEEKPLSDKPVNRPALPSGSRFHEFWKVYPNKAGKKPCSAKWKARNLDDMADIIVNDVLTRIKNHRPWLDGFAPNPLTYLNQDRWEDVIKTSSDKQCPGIGKGSDHSYDEVDYQSGATRDEDMPEWAKQPRSK